MLVFLHTAGDPERLVIWSLVIYISADVSRTPPHTASDTSSQVVSANEGRPRHQDTATFITLLFSFRLYYGCGER